MDYLLKPVDYVRLVKTVERIRENSLLKASAVNAGGTISSNVLGICNFTKQRRASKHIYLLSGEHPRPVKFTRICFIITAM